MGDLIDRNSRRPKPATIDPSEPTKTVNLDVQISKIAESIKRINDLCKSLNEKR